MNTMRTLLLASLFSLTLFAAPLSVAAQTTGVDTGSNTTLLNPLKATNLSAFLQDILSFVIQIGTVIIILMVVYVGYKFVMAQGSDSKLTEAKQMLLWTVVGALVLLGAQAIAMAIQSTVTAITGP